MHIRRMSGMMKKKAAGGYVFTSPAAWTLTTQKDFTGILTDPQSLKYYEGTNRLFILDSYNTLREFSLDTDGDITTAALVQSKALGLSNCNDFYISPDGVYLFVTNQPDPPYLNRFTMSTPWDISTATLNQQKPYSYWGSRPGGIHFRPDGKRFMIATYDSNTSQERYRQYECPTAWDILDSVTQTFAEVSILYYNFCFTPSGHQFVDWYGSGQDCYLHNLQEPWVIENEVSTKTDFPSLGYPSASTFWENGLYAYILNPLTKIVYQYTTDAAPL